LNAGLWFRRGRLAMVFSSLAASCCRYAENPLIPAVQIFAATSRFAAQASVFGDTSLPSQVDLRPHCTAVEDQGRTNSCTANAVVGAMEYHLAKRDGRVTDLSRLFVYYNTRRLNGTIARDGGARISEAMAAALAYGACRAELWPYDISRMAMEPPPQAYFDGLGHEAMQYARVPGAEGAVRALADGLPVVFGCFLPQRCYEEAAQTGRIPATRPDERKNPPNFGHAMLLVGYDLPAKEFIVRNSWGPGWGDGGYCRFSFEEAVMFSPPDAFWVLASLEPRQSFRVSRPDTSAQGPAMPAPAGISAGASANAPSAVFGQPGGARATGAGDIGRGAGPRTDGTVKSEIERMKSQIRGELQAKREALSRTAGRFGGGPTGATAGATSGARQDLRHSVCQMCEGTGVCYQCEGSKKNMGYPCSGCYFTGKCAACGGSGIY